MFSKNYMSSHNGCAASHFRQHFRLTPRYSQERVTYNKEIQTADLESDSGSSSDEEIREPISRERETTTDPERAWERLEEESAILDREIEEEIRGLPTLSFVFCPFIERTCRFDGRRKR
jgi:hypothetical protein